MKSLDAELAVDSRIVRFASRGDEPEGDSESMRRGARQLRDRLPDYHSEDSGVYFQIWSGNGDSIERSGSLGEMELDFPASADVQPSFETVNLDNGVTIRAMSFRTAAGSKGKGKGRRGSAVTILAKETAEIEDALGSLLNGIGLIGLLVGLSSILLVNIALKIGLKPLTDLGEQVESINASRLDARLETGGSPPELRPISERLNSLFSRLESSFERERRFSSDLAHEMRTPIAELKTISEVALKWPDQSGEETHHESLEIAKQLETMVENILALARWESGEQLLKKELVNLAEFLRQCWEPVSGRVAEKGIKVVTEFGVGCWETDRGMLRHIVVNLFSNAVEYTPADGWIRITAGPGSIEVTNSAPDFDPDDLEKLFDRHWRADSSRSDSSHTGLGLSLARGCAEALGMELKASLKDGLCFEIDARQKTG
ncbi:MAG: ATP-binding protein [Verrucomicrobiota bacterium]